MKKLLVIAVAALGVASFAANAKNPHPVSEYTIEGLACSCDWAADPSTCTVSWTDAGASAYGVDVDFEAEWTDESGAEMKAESELPLDDAWTCAEGTCSASGEFALPEGYPADADIEFQAKVKGFDKGRDGPRPRDFVKASADCNLPEPPAQ